MHWMDRISSNLIESPYERINRIQMFKWITENSKFIYTSKSSVDVKNAMVWIDTMFEFKYSDDLNQAYIRLFRYKETESKN